MNKTTRILFVLLMISIFLIRFPFIIDETLSSRLLMASIISLLLYFSLKKDRHFKVPLFLILFSAFYIYSFLSCFWANTFSAGILECQLFSVSLIFVFVIHLIYVEKQLIKISIIISAISLIGSLMGLYYVFNNKSIDFGDIGLISGNKNLFSAIIFLCIPFILNGVINSKKNLRFWFLFTLLFNLLTIVLFQTRSIYVSLILSLLIIIILVLFQKKYRLLLLTKKNILLALAFFLLLIVSTILIKNNVLDTESQKTFLYKSNPINLKNDNSVNERLLLWEKSSDLVKDNFLFGVGAGNWKIEIANYPKTQIPWQNRLKHTFNYPHNELIGVFSDLGVVGFVLLLALMFFPVVVFFQHFYKNRNNINIDLIIYFSFYIGFFFFILVDFPFRRLEHNVLFFILWYLIIIKSRKKYKFITLSGFWINLFVISILLLNAIIAIYTINGEYFTKQVFIYERKNDNLVILNSQKANSTFYRIAPNTLPLSWFEGVANFRKGNYTSALSNFETALKYTPYEVRVLNDYAATLETLGHRKESREMFLKAISIDNYFDESKMNFSAILYQEGKISDAIDLISQTQDCDKKTDYLKFYEVALKKK